MKRNNKKGFTIVELLIVIAVIAILSAVLIPTFSGIVEKANKSAAQQEANALYKNYLIDFDYTNDKLEELNGCVEADGYYFEIAAGQFKPEALNAAKGDVLAHDEVCADNSNPADDLCDICGADLSE